MRNREVVRAELGGAAGHRYANKRAVNEYRRWCEANNLPEFAGLDPDADRTLLVYLHSMTQERGWTFATATDVASSIAGHYISHEELDPRGPLTQAWLRAHRRHTTDPTRGKVDALTMSEVKGAAQACLAGTLDTRAQRALLSVACAMEDSGTPVNPFNLNDYRRLASLTYDAFTISADAVLVAVDDKSVHVDKERSEQAYAFVRAALEDGREQPLAGTSTAQALVMKARNGLRRLDEGLPVGSGRTGAQSVRTSAAQDWWNGAAPRQREMLARHVDSRYATQVQEAAILLTGVLNLLRAADMARLTLAHMSTCAEGYEFVLTEHKGTELAEHQGGKSVAKHGALEHVRDEDGTCAPVCPACVMAKHLELRRDLGAQDEEPLFVSYTGSASGQVLGAAGYRSVMRRAAGESLKPDGTRRLIGSSSARVTGATELRKSGATYSELQEAGVWASPDTAQLYVRNTGIIDPSDLVLDLG